MRLFSCLLLLSLVATAEAQTSIPPKMNTSQTQPDTLRDDIKLDVYLDALAQLAPAAREGADAYLQAFQRHCGRPLKAIELRRRIADGNGDSVLMSMIGAASRHDAATLQQLAASIKCAG